MNNIINLKLDKQIDEIGRYLNPLFSCTRSNWEMKITFEYQFPD